MSKPAIALYLGESYAHIGLYDTPFDTSKTKSFAAYFEKSIFLPQVSLKNLLHQTQLKIQEYFKDYTSDVPVYIVTKYFDRLKQFRLGGSISQVILKGFENSYTISDSRHLSLAASQLIISLDKSEFTENFLELEFNRIKKINPDLNKVVISIPEGHLTSDQIELLNNFFTTREIKIFNCTRAHDQAQLRKTLLNAGSEGIKEEILSDIKEAFGKNTIVNFYCNNGFQSVFENCELFTSSTNFLANFIESSKYQHGAYFDIESLKFIDLTKKNQWLGPWGSIPLEHRNYADLCINPYSEVKLNHLSILQIETRTQQLEPGPVVAGRAMKLLVIDLFYNELLNNNLSKSLFTQLPQEILKSKIQNLFSVLEKGQKNPSLFTFIHDLKKNIHSALLNEVCSYSNSEKTLVFGPLSDVFIPARSSQIFSWPNEIIATAMKAQ